MKGDNQECAVLTLETSTASWTSSSLASAATADKL
jgi:hypothetical protein